MDVVPAFGDLSRRAERGRARPVAGRLRNAGGTANRLPGTRRANRETAYNRDLLLLSLEHPEIPLHNNAMELAARRRVRKRDVSFDPQSRAGAEAWDTFQTIAATAAKLGVGLYHYLRDRCLHPTITLSLADLIRARAHPFPT